MQSENLMIAALPWPLRLSAKENYRSLAKEPPKRAAKFFNKARAPLSLLPGLNTNDWTDEGCCADGSPSTPAPLTSCI